MGHAKDLSSEILKLSGKRGAHMAERRNTRQRQLVLDAVRGRCDHPTADQIYADVREVDARVSRATVYRNLHLLADSGEILAVKSADAERFDLRTDNHAHLVCSSCGAVIDVPMPTVEGVDERIARETGYAVRSHYTVFEGLCPNCQ